MSKLSSNLRDEVFLHTNVKYLTTVKCFSIFDQKTLIKLAGFMRKVRYSPEEFIFRVGNFITLLFIFQMALIKAFFF
jgi:hypothetical protein